MLVRRLAVGFSTAVSRFERGLYRDAQLSPCKFGLRVWALLASASYVLGGVGGKLGGKVGCSRKPMLLRFIKVNISSGLYNTA